MRTAGVGGFTFGAIIGAVLFGIGAIAVAQTPKASPTPRASYTPKRKPIISSVEESPGPSASPSPKPKLTVTMRKVVPPAGAFDAGTLMCTLQSPFINESSGIAASRRNVNVFWTHNDSGDGAYLYAFNRSGKTVGVFLVRSAFAGDWEDIAAGPGPDGKGNYLYIGDIGDYAKDRPDTAIYRIPEPSLLTENRIGTKANPRLTDEPTARLLYRYPDGGHDAEALLVHPQTGVIYLVTKEEKGEASIYKFPPVKATDNPLSRYTLIKVGSLSFSEDGLHPFPNRVTAGDIAPDGKRLVLRTYYAAYEWRLPDGETKFDAIWETTPVMIPLPLQPQGEGICYTPDGSSLVTSSEKTPTNIFELKAK